MPPARHWPLAVLLALAGILIFTALGRDHLWADEGDTAVLARTILEQGVPSAWDGVTFTDSDFGTRLNEDLVMVSSPWLQYYVTAASFALMGETTLAARLPFALAGLATIALVYALLWRVTASVRTATTGALLLTASVQFLLYARQSRHYTLNALLTVLLVWQFQRLASWRDSALFAVTAILLFHSHPIGLAPIVAMGVLTLVYGPFRPKRRAFWRAMPVVAAGTVPWLFVASQGYTEATDLLTETSRFLPRMAQYLVEAVSVSSLAGAAALAVVLRWRLKRTAARVVVSSRKKRAPATAFRLLAPEARALTVTIFAIVGAYACAMAVTQPRDVLWTVGMRYTPAVIPFGAMVAAVVIGRAGAGRRTVWIALVILFAFTKLARPTPWLFWEEPTAARDRAAAVTFHIPAAPVDRVLRTGQVAFVRSLLDEAPGTTARIVAFLRQHAQPRDIVITNYGWEPIYFHTDLPQGLKVLPSYPIFDAARAKNLPSYVFSPEGARWIIWRKAWGAYRGQDCGRLIDALRASGIPVTRVATLRETLWENRENVHFRRFAGDTYIYPFFAGIPDAEIYRVDWTK
jgi:4-amino-4-deoxy-L-arabinose transferase-like glycosyltransferase